MNKTEKLTFIEGTFNHVEAKEILINVFTQKINFHHRKNFSSQERFGKEDVAATKRIVELKKGLEQALAVVEEAQQTDKKISISSEISISVSG